MRLASPTLLLLLLSLAGCSPAKTAAAEKAAYDASVCALEQYEKDPEVTAAKLAVACGATVAEDLWRVIVAHKKAVAVKAAAGPCGSSSAAPAASGSAK